MSKINVGDKVVIISIWDGTYRHYFNLGEIVTVTDVFNSPGKIRANNDKKSQVLRSGHYTKVKTTTQKPALTDEAITELADKINFIKRLKSELNILETRKEDLEETLAKTEEALKTMKDDLGVE